MTQQQVEKLIIKSVNENAALACSALSGVNIDEVSDFINVDGSEEQELFKMIRSDLIKNFPVEQFVERIATTTAA